MGPGRPLSPSLPGEPAVFLGLYGGQLHTVLHHLLCVDFIPAHLVSIVQCHAMSQNVSFPLRA
nr:hypothetical protein [Streptococcus pneumoniae]